jgi:serine/threonine protein kinase
MNCKQCSAPLSEGAVFCESCGAPATSKPQDTLIGRTLINQYIIRAKLGAGGFGAVYEAEQPSMSRKVAIKTLHKHLIHNAQIVARFHREGMAASRLDHPSSVKMFNSGETEDGTLWLAMEFLEGETLDKRIRGRGSLSPDALLEVFRPICEVLEEAHEKGITHRDLKPDNIMLLPRRGKELIKLLDFGIAGLLDGGAMTQTGVVSGTPMYMPPEQWKGLKHTDARSDIYALGVILYQCLSGRLPFEADTAPGWMQKHCLEEPKELSNVNCSEPLKAVIFKSLSKDPNHRPQSARELLTLLDAAIRGEPPKINTQAPTLEQARPQPAQPTLLASAPPPNPPPPAPPVITPAPPASIPGWVKIGGSIVALGGAVLLGGMLNKTSPQASSPQLAPTPQSTATKEPPKETPSSVPQKDTPKNRWIKINPPSAAVYLGLESSKKLPENTFGFRPERKIQAPQLVYSIQEHEVTWGELDEWLVSQKKTLTPPAWVASAPEDRKMLAATGVPWVMAGEFCGSVGGRLPTEEEWEYAARGVARRPYPWGDEPLDLGRTYVYAGPDATPGEVMRRSQDRTPDGIYDLLGNAQEWTTSLWREDTPGQDESWAQAGEISYRAVRGLPLCEPPPNKYQPEASAYRDALCATGECTAEAASLLSHVGFRCVKDER